MTRVATPACALLLGLAVCVPQASTAQPSEEARVETTATLENLTRVETWRFFEPSEPDATPDYSFIGNRAYLGIGVSAPRFDLSGGFAYTTLGPLPPSAFNSGGAMGTGALYRSAAGAGTSYQLYLSELNMTVHSASRRVRFTVGRMPHASGAEGNRTPVDATERDLVSLRRLRMDARLLGGFDWSFYRRRFDGVRLTTARPGWYAAAALVAPTQGGFEESANLTMLKVQVASGVSGFRHRWGEAATGRGETQVFAHLYRDRREVTGRPDLSGWTEGGVDVTVPVVGASHLGIVNLGTRRADWLAWGAVQGGDWYGERHRAWSFALEGGHQWRQAPTRPWIRAGLSHASGDDDPSDDRHGTFFPMLPTMRVYAQSVVYAQMNLRDLFVQALVEPHGRARARVDLHRLDLANRADGWYQGSGANALDGGSFGYAVRPSGGAGSLGTIIEGSIDVAIAPWWSVNAYAGHMWGGDVVRSQFAGDRLTFWYIESVLRLTARKQTQMRR